MNQIFKKSFPYLIILFGLLLLFFIGQPIVAGICILVGIVMVIEIIWPEEWGADIQNERKD